ncbi:MAG: DUF6174 domain-containing protein [Gemmatimonadota bacterium]|jgi:hypothetical protein
MNEARTIARWVVGCLALSMVACGGLGPRDAQRAALEANRARWLSQGPSSYQYALRRSCFCPYLGPVRVTVAADTVVGRVYVESGDPVPEIEADAFPAVDGLFELLDQAFENGADDIDVTYDPELGVPIEISIDYLENAVDDELGIQVTEPVEPLPVALASTS